MSGPLEGIKVIDVSAVVSGPLAAMILEIKAQTSSKLSPRASARSCGYPTSKEAASPHYLLTAIETNEVWRSIFQSQMASR